MVNRVSELLQHLRPYRSNLAVNLVCNVLNAFLSLFTFLSVVPFLRILFNAGVGSNTTLSAKAPAEMASGIEQWSQRFDAFVLEVGPFAALTWICVSIFFITVLKNAVGYLGLYSLATIRTGVSRDLRKRLYEKVLSLPVRWFTESRKGDVISRMTNDLMEVEFSIIGTIEILFKSPISILVSLGTLFYLSWELTLFSILFLPLSGYLISRIAKSLKHAAKRGKEELGGLMSIMEETLSGIMVIKSFRAEKKFNDRFGTSNQRYFELMRRLYKREYLSSPVSETVSLGVMAILLWFGGRIVLKGDGGLSGDWFIGYLVVFSQLIPPARSISDGWFRIQKGTASLDRLDDILQAKELKDSGTKKLNPLEKCIEFRNVSFAYEEKSVLHGINLTINKGETVALVGPSGSGKTTLVHLLARFHEPLAGEICWDGENIEKFDLLSYRDLFGLVTQDARLFNDTVAENIGLGDPGRPDSKRVESAAQAANALDFISAMEKQWEETVGDGGNKLSGGQRQRLSIARALYKDPPLLLLDEATSALDTESEFAVQEAINALMKGRTSLVVAHRLSTIRHADRIVVMEAGAIVEEGNHDSLMAREGLYHRLVTMQDLK